MTLQCLLALGMWAAAVPAAVSPLAPQVTPAEAAPVPSGPRKLSQYIRGRGGAFVNLPAIENPLDERELHEWLQVLGVPQGAIACIEAKHPSLINSHNAVLDREAPALIATSQEAARVERAEGSGSSALCELLSTLELQADRIRAGLEDAEQAFIRDASECLRLSAEHAVSASNPGSAEDQFEPLRLYAARRYWRGVESPFRWGEIEFRPIIEALECEDASRRCLGGARVVVLDHERALTPLVKKYAVAFEDIAPKSCALFKALDDGTMDSETFLSRFSSVRDRFFRAGLSLRVANKRALDSISDALPPVLSKKFRDSARAQVFPELYPDPESLAPLFDALEADAALSVEQLRDTRTYRVAYLSEYDAACRNLELQCEEWSDRNARGEPGAQRQFLPERLAPLMQARSQVGQKWSTALTQTLPPEIMERARAKLPNPPASGGQRPEAAR